MAQREVLASSLSKIARDVLTDRSAASGKKKGCAVE
jgi:hypothetical protein